MEKISSNILEYFLHTSGLDIDYFRRLAKTVNKYGRYHLKNGNFGEKMCRNITVKEVLHFYGVLLQIYTESRHLVVYTSSFE